MTEQYWLTIKICETDDRHRITHNRPMQLKAYFYENPILNEEGDVEGEDNILQVAEYSSVKPLEVQGGQQFDFELTAAEFNAADFRLYIWGEPYGYVAVQKDEILEGLYVGRLELLPKHCYKGVLLHPPLNHRSAPNSKQIYCEITIGQSVADYMADEFNRNLNSDEFQQIKKQIDRAQDSYRRSGITRDSKEGYERGALMRLNSVLGAGGGRSMDYPADMNMGDHYTYDVTGDFACLVHSRGVSISDWRERIAGKFKEWGQDVALCNWGRRFRREGGMWDHKPHIYNIWGARNRLGNSGFFYYYDIWSNMHYGFVGIKAGFSEEHLLSGADRAQVFDNAGATQDDPIDREAILAGIRLAGRKDTVTIDDFLTIIRHHPGWVLARRDAK